MDWASSVGLCQKHKPQHPPPREGESAGGEGGKTTSATRKNNSRKQHQGQNNSNEIAVQFNPVPRPTDPAGGQEGLLNRNPLPVFSAEGRHVQHQGPGCPHFEVVCQTFLLPPAVLPTLQGALKDGFVEAVVACDIPEPLPEQV